MPQPYIFDNECRITNVNDAGCAKKDVGYNSFSFLYRTSRNFAAAKPTKGQYKCVAVVPADKNGFALVVTNKLISVSSDGQRHCDLI